MMKSYVHDIFENYNLRIQKDVLVADKTTSIAPPVPLCVSPSSCPYLFAGIYLACQLKSYEEEKSVENVNQSGFQICWQTI